MADSDQYNIEYYRVTFPAEHVAHVEINRPEKLNAFRPEMWNNLRLVFDRLSTDPNARVILFSGAGDRAFTAGLDVKFAAQSGPVSQPDATTQTDTARRATAIRRHILDYQDAVTSLERCEKPIILLLHGIAYGAALDLASAACIRLAAPSARLCVKEVDLGLAADVGSLSRLPKLGVPLSWVKEVAYSARVFGAAEALRVGLVSGVSGGKGPEGEKRALVEMGLELARRIAGKSPVAVQGTKALLDYSRDRTVEEGLRMTAVWNAAMLQASDVRDAMGNAMGKGKVSFAKL